MQSLIRTCFGSCLFLAIGCLLIGSTDFSAVAQVKKDTTFTPKSPNAFVKLGNADVKIDATAWYNEFKADFNGSRRKYDKKVIELTGKVVGFSEDFGNVRIKLEADNSGQTINCYTVERKPWQKVSPGATVKLKGILPESGTVGDLGSVQIVDAGKYETLTLTATQLAADYAKGRKDAVTKYNRKWCHLSGEVIEAKDAPGGRQVTLKTDGGISVVCISGTFGNNDPIASLKKGAKVKLFGQLIVEDKDEKKVFLINSLVS